MDGTVAHFFSAYAYYPIWIYACVIGFMLASAFGLPLPEEVILVSSGILGYMSLHPEEFPPPYPGAHTVNVYFLAVVALIAVLCSDFLIFSLGRRFGPRLLQMKFFSRMISPERMARTQAWVRRYGYFTVLLFRFTPGIRFPGHLMCGAMGLTPWKFLAVDGLAALISVPTQVLLISFFGEPILKSIREFKIVLLSLAAILIVFLVVRHFTRKHLRSRLTRKHVKDNVDPAI
jgi:membrane protein DedA with SNARE-associated domain